MEWALMPGQKIRRTQLHDQFGGGRQGGISPSARTANVFVFSDSASGEQHGYIDSWKDDGCFHYTGEGQRGDQRMVGGNRAILTATQEGRSLRVFEGTGGVVEYKGLFSLDPDQPWYEADAPETGYGPVRSVIVFRLRPVDAPPAKPSGTSVVPAKTVVASVAIEDMHTEKAVVDPSREPYEAERRESALVQRFKHFMESKGQVVERLMITPSGEAKSIFTDVYLRGLNILVEAKGGIDRCSIRMAIGQLIDYSRFAPANARLAVLLPSIPRDDLRKLLVHAGVLLYVPKENEFLLMDECEHCLGLVK
jgi:hypothetical protein